MKLKTYAIQSRRNETLPFFIVPRVDYAELLDTLKFPIIWSYDELIENWIPAESTFEFVKFLKSTDFTNISELPDFRILQLRRSNLLQQNFQSKEVLREKFKKDGFVKLNQILDRRYCSWHMNMYYEANIHKRQRHRDMEGIVRTSVNNLPLMRLIHQSTENLIEYIVDEPIKTSYSFMSQYEEGSNLPAHTDRSQCVYNISLMLGSQPSGISLSGWPIFIKVGDKVNTITLECGDGVLYSGTKDLHWRDTMPTELKTVLGVFFHYVRKDFTGSLD